MIMDAPRPLTVGPGPPLSGELRLPGDKSITHRAYLLALLAPGETRVRGANPGEDCAGTLACARELGVQVEAVDGGVRLSQHGLHAPDGVLDCGNSGSTLRMLAGVLASQLFDCTLDGDASLRRRPLGRIIEPLRRMGATLSAADSDRRPPLTVRGARLRGITAVLPVASAQVASAIEFAALAAEGETVIEIPGPARDHTERMLGAVGVALEIEPLAHGGRRVRVRGGAAVAPFRSVEVPGDFSAAAFALAAAATRRGARVRACGVSLNPTRLGLLDVMRAMGATVTVEPGGESGGEPFGDIVVEGAELRAFDVPQEWVARLIDEVPAWVILAANSRGVSRLRGAAELRVKESDRIATLARALEALGMPVEEHADGLSITGAPIRGGRIEAAGDHRIAMAFATLGTLANAAITVDDARAIATSYPAFERHMAALGARIMPAPLEHGR